MIVETEKRKSETIGKSNFEVGFSIGDTAKMLGIFRDKMYANSKKAICREITSNARDAHREAGIPDLPIEIHLPNDMDPHLRIKDYGPGISQHRIANVFVLYGNTTKDGSNEQTGGWGLGAKTPFSYTDQFQVTTIVAGYNGKNIKSVYVCYLDETKCGKMRELATIETDEPCGTEVSVKIERNDYNVFAEYILDVCQWWNPRPNLTGRAVPDWEEDKQEIIVSGNSWDLIDSKEPWASNSLAVIDGIKYPINIYNIKSEFDDKITDTLKKGVRLFFNTGDIDLTPSREELKYSDKTQDQIKDRVKEIISRIKEIIIEDVDLATNYVDAVLSYKTFKEKLSFAIPEGYVAYWKGNQVSDTKVIVGESDNYCINTFVFKENRRTYTKKINKISSDYIIISKDNIIVLNDLSNDSISISRIENLLKNNGYNSVQVITYFGNEISKVLEEMKGNNHHSVDINWLNPVTMSTLDLMPKVNRANGGPTGKSGRSQYSAFVYDKMYKGTRACDNNWVPENVDLNTGGIYVSIQGTNNKLESCNHNINLSNIEALKDYMDKAGTPIRVIAIRKRDLQKVSNNPNWVEFKTIFDNVINEYFTSSDITMLDIQRIKSNVLVNALPFNSNVNDIINRLVEDGIIDNDNIMAKNIALKKNYTKEYKKHSNIISLINNVDRQVLISSIIEEAHFDIKNKYPLLCFIENWAKFNQKDISKYILLIDNEDNV